MFSSQIIISVIIIKSKSSRSPHPSSLLAPICEMSLQENGEKMCWILGFYHSTPFLMKKLLIAEFRIQDARQINNISSIKIFFNYMAVSEKKIYIRNSSLSSEGKGLPFLMSSNSNLELLSKILWEVAECLAPALASWFYNTILSHHVLQKNLGNTSRNQRKSSLNLCREKLTRTGWVDY